MVAKYREEPDALEAQSGDKELAGFSHAVVKLLQLEKWGENDGISCSIHLEFKIFNIDSSLCFQFLRGRCLMLQLFLYMLRIYAGLV